MENNEKSLEDDKEEKIVHNEGSNLEQNAEIVQNTPENMQVT